MLTNMQTVQDYGDSLITAAEGIKRLPRLSERCADMRLP